MKKGVHSVRLFLVGGLQPPPPLDVAPEPPDAFLADPLEPFPLDPRPLPPPTVRPPIRTEAVALVLPPVPVVPVREGRGGGRGTSVICESFHMCVRFSRVSVEDFMFRATRRYVSV